MTAKAALCDLLLKGKVINIKNCFSLIGLTNAPREISRMIEQPFGVVVSRIHKTGKSRYGQPVTWYDYKLLPSPLNNEGIEKMKEYVKAQSGGVVIEPTTPVSGYVRRKKVEDKPSNQDYLI